MKLLSVLLVIAALSVSTDAYWYGGWGYYYPYSFGYYPYAGWYGLGWYGKRSETTPVAVKTECLYIKNDNIFKCKGPLGEVECDAELELDETIQLEMFGIGKPENFDEDKSIKLFPRKLDNTGWTNNLIKIKGEDFNVSIHQQDSKDIGLMVKESKCFKKVLDLLKDSNRDELINLEDIGHTEKIVGDFSVVMRNKRSMGKYDDMGKEVTERDDEEIMMDKEHEHERRMYNDRYGGNNHRHNYQHNRHY